MFDKRLICQVDSFGDSFLRDAALPLSDNRLSSHAARDLIQNLPNHNARATKSRLAVTNLGVTNNMATYNSLIHGVTL